MEENLNGDTDWQFVSVREGGARRAGITYLSRMVLVELCQKVELFEVNTGVFVQGPIS